MVLEAVSVAERMSWASKRCTRRPEDVAYCLLGLFDVNMPLLYSEGAGRAFLRLQLEILRQSDDETIFAWETPGGTALTRSGLLAHHPRDFAGSANIRGYKPDSVGRPAYATANKGLQLWTAPNPMTVPRLPNVSTFCFALRCDRASTPERGLGVTLLQSVIAKKGLFCRIGPLMDAHPGIWEHPYYPARNITVRQRDRTNWQDFPREFPPAGPPPWRGQLDRETVETLRFIDFDGPQAMIS